MSVMTLHEDHRTNDARRIARHGEGRPPCFQRRELDDVASERIHPLARISILRMSRDDDRVALHVAPTRTSMVSPMCIRDAMLLPTIVSEIYWPEGNLAAARSTTRPAVALVSSARPMWAQATEATICKDGTTAATSGRRCDSGALAGR
jgi:hypothetical protein